MNKIQCETNRIVRFEGGDYHVTNMDNGYYYTFEGDKVAHFNECKVIAYEEDLKETTYYEVIATHGSNKISDILTVFENEYEANNYANMLDETDNYDFIYINTKSVAKFDIVAHFQKGKTA